MSEQYRLVFSGEVLEGQHQAVVKKRLAAILKLDDKRMDVLFSGKSVVVKNATDEANAARYQAAFQKAGARLRVLPAGDESAPIEESAATNSAAETPLTPNEQQASGELELLPSGSSILNEDERSEVVPVEVETSHLKVQGAIFTTDEPADEVAAPDVEHITLAELGAVLGHAAEDAVLLQEIDVEFDLAEVGAVIGALEAEEVPPLAAPDFDLADPGADLDTTTKTPPPSAPDTSHLKLDEEGSDETTRS